VHVVGCNSNSSGSSSIQTMLVDTTVLCLLLKGKRSISYEWNRRNPLIYTLTLLMKKLGLCSSRRTCRLTSNSASEMQSQCWVYTVPPSVEFLHYFFLLVAAAARTIIMTTSLLLALVYYVSRYPPVANFLKFIYATNYEIWLALQKVIAIIIWLTFLAHPVGFIQARWFFWHSLVLP